MNDRRAILRISLGSCLTALAVAVLRSGDKMRGKPAREQDDRLNWEELLETVSLEAAKQHGISWNEEAYVDQVASLARRLAVPEARFQEMRRLMFRSMGHPSFDSLYRTQDFEVVQISFQTADSIPAHDHPNMTGVSLCLRGTVNVRSYEPVAKDSQGKARLVRLVGNRHLKIGDAGTLTRRRANIHSWYANEEATIIDLFTPAYDPIRAQNTNWYVLEPDGRSPGIFKSTASS